jgi:ABC-type multidrug transport system fused ATPase/permease subunit
MANSKLSNSHQFDLADIKSIPISDTNDEIQSLNKDYEQIPFCSEKLILKLILYYSLKVDRTFSYKFSKNEKSILETDFNSLDERIEIENLLKHKFQVDNYENIKNYHQYSAEENLSNLKIFLNSIREINIQELLRLTKSNNDAINKIKDKDVYLLFGPTGAGKSTTLHFLGGSKMEEQLIDGKVHILPVNITNKDLKDVKTGLSAIKSETRLVIPVKIPINASEYGFDNVMFCDLPGFGDTNGPEIDISNSIAIDECIKVNENLIFYF